MEKGSNIIRKLPLLAALGLLLVAAFAFSAGVTSLAGSDANTAAKCTVTPQLFIEQENVPISIGSAKTITITVTAMHDVACGPETYGVDFTNAYAGDAFNLAIMGKQERNLFTLGAGQSRTFGGVIGIPPYTLPGNYTVQVTAYSEDDHWKQVSRNIKIEAKPINNYTYWKTDLTIGWNNVPYVEGISLYGCPNITSAYRFSPSKNDYITMNRYGPLLVPARNETVLKNEQFGGLFVFSRERCTVESIVPNERFSEEKLALSGSQLLTIPPAWNNEPTKILGEACTANSNVTATVEMKYWNAGSQKWTSASSVDILKTGQVWQITSSAKCTLDLGQPLETQRGNIQ